MEHRNEIIISIIFAVLIALFLDPFMLWMPDSLMYMLVGALVIFFTLFAGFMWKERALDEREQLHKMIAGRIGYLIGVGVLVLGLVVQTFTTHPDPWLVVALGGMVIGKLLGLLYSRYRF
ncbi:MAG TPA: hypothetical protein VGA06_00650 [Candidatus Paceibacterota bacterium]|jgi:ABC-type iron transport system FetAB permease component